MDDNIKMVKDLKLPAGQYVVFGAGPMAAHHIRPTQDVDILVTTELYVHLKSEGWEEKDWPNGGHYLTKGIFEVDDSWEYGGYNPRPEDVIAAAEVIDGIPFAPLEEVLKWKKSFDREKDKADVKLIEEYLAAN